MYDIKLSEKALDLIYNTIKEIMEEFEETDYPVSTIAEEITNHIEIEFNKKK